MDNKEIEHLKWMSAALKQALTQGVEFWAEDTPTRTAWLEDDELAWHTIAGTMLTGCFAYAEGKLDKYWWNMDSLQSDAAKRDLPLLWIARNAFAHKDNIPADLHSTTEDDIKALETYCAQLEKGETLDDKGNAYPVFMTFKDSEIRFTRGAIHIFERLFNNAYRAFRID